VLCGDGAENQARGGCDSAGNARCGSSSTGAGSCTIQNAKGTVIKRVGVSAAGASGAKMNGNSSGGVKAGGISLIKTRRRLPTRAS
jgi:hypothetical protein